MDQTENATTNGAQREDSEHRILIGKTQLPVRVLFDHIGQGGTPDSFVSAHPEVKRSQAIAFLERARDLLAAGGPKAYVLDPGPDMLAIYQKMCRQSSCDEFERREFESWSGATLEDNGTGFSDIIAEFQETLRRQKTNKA